VTAAVAVPVDGRLAVEPCTAAPAAVIEPVVGNETEQD